MSNSRQSASERARLANESSANESFESKPYVSFSSEFPRFFPRSPVDMKLRITSYVTSNIGTHPEPFMTLTDDPYDLKNLPKYGTKIQDQTLASFRPIGVHWVSMNGVDVPISCKRIFNGQPCALCSELFKTRKQKGILSKTGKRETEEYKNLEAYGDKFTPSLYVAFVAEILSINEETDPEQWDVPNAQRHVIIYDKLTKFYRLLKSRINKLSKKNPNIQDFADFTDTGMDIEVEFDWAGEGSYKHIAASTINLVPREALDDSILDSETYPKLDDMVYIQTEDEVIAIAEKLKAELSEYNDMDDSGNLQPDTNSVEQPSVPQTSVNDISEDDVKQMMEASSVTVEVDEPTKVKPKSATTAVNKKPAPKKASESAKVDDEWANM